jgi:hypothetical protein
MAGGSVAQASIRATVPPKLQRKNQIVRHPKRLRCHGRGATGPLPQFQSDASKSLTPHVPAVQTRPPLPSARW